MMRRRVMNQWRSDKIDFTGSRMEIDVEEAFSRQQLVSVSIFVYAERDYPSMILEAFHRQHVALASTQPMHA